MKTITAVSVLLAALNLSASETYANITNFWHSGQHSNALAIAEQRLSANTNDIAGLLVRASWDFAFSDASTLSNSLLRMVQVARTVSSPAFTNILWITEWDVESVLANVEKETPEQRQEDVLKETAPGNLPHYWHELDALDQDGYFNQQ